MSEPRQELEALLSRRAAVRPLAKKEIWTVQERWRRTFGQGYAKETGNQIKAGLEWQAIEIGQPHLEGARAGASYKEVQASTWVIWANGAKPFAAFECEGTLPEIEQLQRLLDRHRALLDCVLLDADGQWTAVFTSEWGPEHPFLAFGHPDGPMPQCV